MRHPVLVPEDVRRNGGAERHVLSLTRAAVASGRAVFVKNGRDAANIAAREWPHDDTAAIILRAATSPAALGNAATTALLTTVVADLLATIGPVAAGPVLLRRGVQLSFNGALEISMPSLIADANHAAFIGEGQPIPGRVLGTSTPPMLAPHKMLALWALTREQIESSNAEALIADAMRRSAGLALDKYLFDSTAGDSVRPPGLRNGISALTASNNPDLLEAMFEDAEKLFNAVAPIGGDVILIASIARAQMLRLRARGGTLPPVLGSPAIAADDLLAVATDGLVCVLDGAPEISSGRDVVVHEDTAPTAISIPGSPPTLAIPTRSYYQTDSISQRLKFDVTWGLRDPRAIAWVATTW